MKKISVVLFALILASTVYGCGSEEDVRGEITSTVEESSTEETVATEETAEVEDTTEAEEKELELGATEGSVYENAFIGIGYQLPDGWTFYTDEQIMELNNATSEMAGEEYQQLMEEVSIIYDMFATDADGLNNININMEKGNPVQLLALDLAQNYEAAMSTMKSTYENMGYENFEYEIGTIDIDGEEVVSAHITVEINDVSVYQTLFAVKCNGYLANVAVTSYFDDITADILGNLYWID